jgi:hypothetical protein
VFAFAAPDLDQLRARNGPISNGPNSNGPAPVFLVGKHWEVCVQSPSSSLRQWPLRAKLQLERAEISAETVAEAVGVKETSRVVENTVGWESDATPHDDKLSSFSMTSSPDRVLSSAAVSSETSVSILAATSLSNGVILSVTTPLDGPPDSSVCLTPDQNYTRSGVSFLNSSTCTLRAAVAYCISNAAALASQPCQIYLELSTLGSKSAIALSATYGELTAVSDEPVTIHIIGGSDAENQNKTVIVLANYTSEAERYSLLNHENCTNITVHMVDTYCDGWQGNKLYFSTADMSVYLTLPSGCYSTQQVCLPPGTYTPFACGGVWPGEVSWTVLEFDLKGTPLSF